MKIGILTYHRARNYGAFMQAFGLCARLNEEESFQAEIIDYHMDKEIRSYEINSSLINRLFKRKQLAFMDTLSKSFGRGLTQMERSEEYCHSDSIEDFRAFISGKYDCVLVGSDEVWKTNGFRGFPTPYWLPGELRAVKVSYAASSRCDFQALPEEKQNQLRELLRDFSLISVRDTITFQQIHELAPELDSKLMRMPDPSLISHYSISKENGKKLIESAVGKTIDRKIAVVMTGDKNLAQRIKKACGNEYVMISVFNYQKGYCNLPDLTPFEWADVISAADMVFTSYFHAVCFSLISSTPFIAFGTQTKSDKVREVLTESGNIFRFLDAAPNSSTVDIIKNMLVYCEKKTECTQFLQNCEERYQVFRNRLLEINKKGADGV